MGCLELTSLSHQIHEKMMSGSPSVEDLPSDCSEEGIISSLAMYSWQCLQSNISSTWFYRIQVNKNSDHACLCNNLIQIFLSSNSNFYHFLHILTRRSELIRFYPLPLKLASTPNDFVSSARMEGGPKIIFVSCDSFDWWLCGSAALRWVSYIVLGCLLAIARCKMQDARFHIPPLMNSSHHVLPISYYDNDKDDLQEASAYASLSTFQTRLMNK